MWESSYLPFLPGYSFTDPTKTHFPIPQTFQIYKGCRIPGTILPNTTLKALQLVEGENKLCDNTIAELTYGPKTPIFRPLVLPDYVAQDKKVLRFYAYFREEIYDWPCEEYRIHPVVIFYYLETDMMEIFEPKVENSQLPQGKLIRRQKFPRHDSRGHPTSFWKWKELNNGVDIKIYGKKFHIVDCDQWTKEFLTSSGIIVNGAETMPRDPYTAKREALANKPTIEPPDNALLGLQQFLLHDREVLRFHAMWDDTNNIPSEKRKVRILYYLSDDSMEVIEVQVQNSGRDPFPSLIKRQKLPKDRYDIPVTFPLTVMELSNDEIKEYFSPKDFKVGETVVIYGFKFFIYDCDEFTKEYYRKNFGIPEIAEIDVKPKPPPKPLYVLPPHDGLGSWEDSLQNCFSLTPKPPKKSIVKWLQYDSVFLRFEAFMDTVWPVEKDRRFIIVFFPGDDSVLINEPPIMNSGFASGIFRAKDKLRKNVPGDEPVFYGAGDFYLGAIIEASGRRFMITDADYYVVRFMEHNRKIYKEEHIEAMKKRFEEDEAKRKEELERLKGRRVEKTLTKEDVARIIRQQIRDRCRSEANARVKVGLDPKGLEDRHIFEDILRRRKFPADEELTNVLLDFLVDENQQIDLAEFNYLVYEPIP